MFRRAGRPAAGVGDEDHGADVALADGVGPLRQRDRERRGVGRPCLHGLLHRGEPRTQVDLLRGVGRVLPADREVERRGGELQRRRGDLPRRERLEGELAGMDVSAPLPRTSRIRPASGSRPTSRTNSATKASGSSTLKVKIRTWPKVPELVTTLRARKTPGIVELTCAPGSAGSVDSSTAVSPRSCSTTPGAKIIFRALPTSSACRSSPIDAAAVETVSTSASGGRLGATSHGSRSSRRRPSAPT